MTTQSAGCLNLIGNLLAAQPVRSQMTDMSESFQSYVEASGKTQKGYKDGQRVSATTGQKDISHRDAYAAGYPDGERCETTIRDKQVAGTQMPEGVSAGDGISKEQLKEFISEMRDTLKKSLNLDDEQLDDLLAQLNLNVLQLLQPENLQNLLLTAAGKEPLDLVTDSSLADLLQNMQQSLDVLAGKLEINAQDMDSEQMTELLKQLSESNGENGIWALKADEAVDGENHTTPEMKEPATQKNDLPELKNQTEEYTVHEENTGIDVTVKTQAETEESGTGRGENFQQEIAGGIVNRLSQAVQDTESIPAAFQADVQQTEILQQLVERIRVFQGNDVQKMEVQLYPEHLGKVQIQVAMKSGVMTAQITAETEIAKRAIESQLVQLKENFEQQNLKVDAVEVSEATSGFQSEQERQDGMNKQEEKTTVRRRGLRGMNLEEEEPEEEAETEVLKAQGASVEFRA